MGTIQPPQPVKFLAGLLIPNENDLEILQPEIESLLGPIEEHSPLHPFSYTRYYEAEMGPLLRTFVLFRDPALPDRLTALKQASNQLEDRYRRDGEGRRVNIDPGYLSASQLVLASTKPFSHRIYVERGIWAEVTLLFKQGSFTSLPWTYPDYAAHIPLFNAWRERYKQQMKDTTNRRPAPEDDDC